MRPPGFEPGLGAWGAPVLDQARPRPQLNQEKLLELKIGYGEKNFDGGHYVI